MDSRIKPFTTTLMGSMPRSEELLKLKEMCIKNNVHCYEYREKLFSETKKNYKYA